MMAKHAKVPLMADPGESFKNEEFYRTSKLSLRSKRFRGVGEQRKSEERDFGVYRY